MSPDSKDNEQRHYHRVYFRNDADIALGLTHHHCEIKDLSLQGCLLKFDHAWSEIAQSPVTLRVGLSEDIVITMDLEAVHVTGACVGFKCLHIDLDSLAQLRRLIELNLGDSDLLLSDIHFLSTQRNQA